MAEMKAPWMRVARALEGEAEIAGKAANPRIVEMFKVADLPNDPAFKSDETAWCAAFANACLRCAGYQGTKSALAASFAGFGFDLGRTPQSGCVVVFKPMSDGAGSGHVAFFVSEDGDRIKVLGGNQHDKVQVSSFPKEKWRAYRCPTHTAPTPSTSLPPTLTLAPTEAPDHVHAAGLARPELRPLITPPLPTTSPAFSPSSKSGRAGFPTILPIRVAPPIWGSRRRRCRNGASGR